MDKVAIEETLYFMKGILSDTDIFEVLEANGLNYENFEEDQLFYVVKRDKARSYDAKAVFQALQALSLFDLRLVNFTEEQILLCAKMLGGVYYSKAIAQLVDKKHVALFGQFFEKENYKFILKAGAELKHPFMAIKSKQMTDDILIIGYSLFTIMIRSYPPIVLGQVARRIPEEWQELITKTPIHAKIAFLVIEYCKDHFIVPRMVS